MTETSLGGLMEVFGVMSWEDVFPSQICQKCSVKDFCDKEKKRCAALLIVGALACETSIRLLGPVTFFETMKDAIKAVYQEKSG